MFCNDTVKMSCPCSWTRGRVPFNSCRCSQLCFSKSNVKTMSGAKRQIKIDVCRKNMSCPPLSHSIPLDLGTKGSMLHKRKKKPGIKMNKSISFT